MLWGRRWGLLHAGFSSGSRPFLPTAGETAPGRMPYLAWTTAAGSTRRAGDAWPPLPFAVALGGGTTLTPLEVLASTGVGRLVGSCCSSGCWRGRSIGMLASGCFGSYAVPVRSRSAQCENMGPAPGARAHTLVALRRSSPRAKGHECPKRSLVDRSTASAIVACRRALRRAASLTCAVCRRYKLSSPPLRLSGRKQSLSSATLINIA